MFNAANLLPSVILRNRSSVILRNRSSVILREPFASVILREPFAPVILRERSDRRIWLRINSATEESRQRISSVKARDIDSSLRSE